jgi:hypothetical protein
LLSLKIVQDMLETHDGNYPNALRALLKTAIEKVRPGGERRFTGEWMLYNILEMKFLEGKKVREIATKLAMSEADLYRKQRVALKQSQEKSHKWKKKPGNLTQIETLMNILA